MKAIVSVLLAGFVTSGAGAWAQTPAAGRASQESAAQQAAAARARAEQNRLRYQIGQMERVLEGAVEHGAKEMRDRLKLVLPTETTLLTDNARVRGFRLESYGIFFDVVVPSLLETLPWSFSVFDQTSLGLDSALKTVHAALQNSGDPGVEQAFERIALQVGPAGWAGSGASGTGDARGLAGSVTAATASGQKSVDNVLDNPEDAWRTEVKQALMDAMLDYSSSLQIGPEEWLTVGARRADDRPRLAPADSDAQTVLISLRGVDLAAFLAHQIPREEALKRIEIRVF